MKLDDRIEKYLDGIEKEMPLIAKEQLDWLVFDAKRNIRIGKIVSILTFIAFCIVGYLHYKAPESKWSSDHIGYFFFYAFGGLFGGGFGPLMIICNYMELDRIKRKPKAILYRFFKS